MGETEVERMDSLIMGTREIHCLLLVAPVECRPKDTYHHPYASERPGIYIRQHGLGTSPAATPNNAMKLLSKDDALLVAAAIDKVAQPSSHAAGAFNRGREGDATFPGSYVEFVERWYRVLGRRLGRAIDATDERRMELREVRAGIVGVSGGGGSR